MTHRQMGGIGATLSVDCGVHNEDEGHGEDGLKSPTPCRRDSCRKAVGPAASSMPAVGVDLHEVPDVLNLSFISFFFQLLDKLQQHAPP